MSSAQDEKEPHNFATGALPPQGREWEIGLTKGQIDAVWAEIGRRVAEEREACAAIVESASSIETQISGLEVTRNGHDYAAEVLTACAGTIRERKLS